MNSTRILGLGLAGLMLATLVVSVVPSASAQLEQACGTVATPSVKLDGANPPTGPIKPITGQDRVTFKLKYEATQGTSVTPVTLTIKVVPDNPEYTAISWTPQTFFINFEQDGQGKTETFDVNVDVAFTQAAPAFAKTKLKLEVTGTAGTCVQAPAKLEEQSPQIQVGFYERYQARFDKTIHKTGQNAQVSIPMVLQNFGNGDIQVRFSLAEQSSGAINVALPPPVIVRSLATGGETDTANLPLDIQTPFKNGYENRRDQLLLNIDGNAADDADIKLTRTQLNAVIQTQGVYVPGFEAVTMLGALLGALLVARRRL